VPFKHRVAGSNPARLTKILKDLPQTPQIGQGLKWGLKIKSKPEAFYARLFSLTTFLVAPHNS
jgi:hypothetical protein